MTLEQQPQDQTQPVSPSTAAPASVTAESQPKSGGKVLKEWGYCGNAMRARMIAVALVTVLLIGLAIVLQRHMPLTWAWGLTLGLAAVAWIHHAILYFYRTMTIRYRLSDFHLYHIHGLFTRTTDTMEIINIEDVRATQTLWDRFINGGVGTVTVFCKSDRTNSGDFTMRGVEDPHNILDAIDTIRQERRGKRAMLQM